jgi:C_GCAxxG_C_C family probable redox protein
MTKPEIAVNYFKNGFNCSQAVFTSIAQDFGISEDDCLRIGAAFGGGMARCQMTCGAVTGALMAIGLKYGRALNDNQEKKAETYEKTLEFFSEFKKRNGSVNCKELLRGLDMNDPEDKKIIEDLKLFQIACNKYVMDAADIVQVIIENK